MADLSTLEEAQAAIATGKPHLVAGDARLLTQLPKGPWIGGTTAYFMTQSGGCVDRDRLFLTPLAEPIQSVSVRSYSDGALANIPSFYPTHGCSFIVLPAGSRAHLLFARDCFAYPGLMNQPLVGWNAGVHLDAVEESNPLVLDGTTGEYFENRAVVMHASLDPEYYAKVEIINPFARGNGDTITFPHSGFTISECLVNGELCNFAEYLLRHSIDTRLPLVADYAGALINVSFQGIDIQEKRVRLYAPVFAGVEYRLAVPSESIDQLIRSELKARNAAPVFSCNCILNFLYAELEGKGTGIATGPVTFGELAYIQLNQTLVYLTFERDRNA